MDLRQAAEDRAQQLQKQSVEAQREKNRYSVRNRAYVVQNNTLLKVNEDLYPLSQQMVEHNPESIVEIDQNSLTTVFDHTNSAEPDAGNLDDSLSGSNLAVSTTTISPYKDTNDRYRESVRRRSVKSMPLKDENPKELLAEMYLDNAQRENITPKLAKLNASEYKLNGVRARANSDEHLRPRWVPDETLEHCMLCCSQFDFQNRRHHCRNCGSLVCDSCSSRKLLLPVEFGIRNPERVCTSCYDELLPLQSHLVNNIANHERENEIMPIFESDFPSCHIRRYSNLPIANTLGSEIRKATYSIYNLFNLQYIQDKSIPLRLLSNAKGIAFLTVVKGGILFAPRFGTGLVISRVVRNGEVCWSAPSAIATVGLSWGAVLGLDVTDYVIILNTDSAVEAFLTPGQLTIGLGLEIAVGPVGRAGSAEAHITHQGLIAPAYSYSHSRGLFGGVSLDGSIIFTRSSVNETFYGRAVAPSDLLTGLVPPPRAAKALYTALEEALAATPQVEHSAPSPMMGKLMNVNQS